MSKRKSKDLAAEIAAKSVVELAHEILENADDWLDCPNTLFEGRAPRELIGTPEEHRVRAVFEAYVFGLTIS